MKKLLAATVLLFSLPVSAKSLPPILEYLPSCSPNVIDGIYVEKQLADIPKNKLIESSFHQVRTIAKDKRVDAVIITNLIQTNKLIITADLIDYCDEDRSLSGIRTAYNQLSRRPITFERTNPSSISTPKKKSPASISIPETRVAQAQTSPQPKAKPAPKPAARASSTPRYTGVRNFKSELLSELELAKIAAKADRNSGSNVTLSGAYGVNINNSAKYVRNLLGPASAEFTLGRDTKAWLYGRDLWVIFENDKVQKVTYRERSLLNYTGRNIILYDQDFDNNWLIDDKAGFRDDVPNVRRKLNYLKQQSKTEFTVSNQKNLLKLDFAEFSSYNTTEPEVLLSGFTFHSRDYYQDIGDIIYSQIDETLLDDLLLPNFNAPDLKLEDIVVSYVPNIINYSQDGSWEVLSKYLQVKHDDHEITQVRLTESINYPVETDQDFMNFLRQANIPATKEEMMRQYPTNAEVWAENLMVTHDDYEVRAEFASDDDDAMLISLEVIYL
ncbi:hypothetical protein G3R49_05045 [Shewanella sp. WXL01]|uniref:Uncharacterized protein n=1 Tax=Shewanella maritima TaxID=2520507 RepID=A0A411PEK4_9GAMM|nr:MULTISPECIES: hypothetical protein [Shewanella]NKF49937.1 hypothetical protein [Shewanella sp. WXL01]QBF82006.1 hypothetical protein EXU30_04290 [Shewanella maritima]